MMRVYICGPMTNIPNWNRKAFERAACQIRDKYPNCEVISPIELADQDGGLPSEGERIKEGNKYRRAILTRDFNALLICTHLVYIHGWIDSSGAYAEYHVAIAIGMPHVDLDIFLGN